MPAPVGWDGTKLLRSYCVSHSARQSHQVLAFNNKLWVIGGRDDNNGRLNEVWSSVNGISWVQETAAAAFSARYVHQALVFSENFPSLFGIFTFGLG